MAKWKRANGLASGTQDQLPAGLAIGSGVGLATLLALLFNLSPKQTYASARLFNAS
jgi:hypothetical protein